MHADVPSSPETWSLPSWMARWCTVQSTSWCGRDAFRPRCAARCDARRWPGCSSSPAPGTSGGRAAALRAGPTGSRRAVLTPRGSRPHGLRPHGLRPHGLRPHGLRPHGLRPHGLRPHGLRSRGSGRPSGHRSGRLRASQALSRRARRRRVGRRVYSDRRRSRRPGSWPGRAAPPCSCRGPQTRSASLAWLRHCMAPWMSSSIASTWSGGALAPLPRSAVGIGPAGAQPPPICAEKPRIWGR
jgi:hypothetical protein